MECKKKIDPFNAEKFVDLLLEEGHKVPCDDSVNSFNKCEIVPPFYDENLYRRGQEFFYKHIFALFFGKFLGLVAVLSIPSIVRLLIFTKMSGSPLTAYKRYMATIHHMCIWYESDLSIGSRLWCSIKDVRTLHNSSSKRGCTAGLHRISQRDMALTQFGFMGFALSKREKIGLFKVKDEEWRAFIHIWRVVGYMMGIEDRFNICRDSVEETTDICNLLIEKKFRPSIEKSEEEFTTMASNLIEGMWVMNPTLNFKVMMVFLHELVDANSNNNKTWTNFNLNTVEDFMLRLVHFTMWSVQFTVFRLYHNYVKLLALWLMKVFPFLAFYKYGYSKSYTYTPFRSYRQM